MVESHSKLGRSLGLSKEEILGFIAYVWRRSGDRMKIIFSNHFKKRKVERDDFMIPVSNLSELNARNLDLESILRRKGKWYVNYETKDKVPRIYCIVNNLEVYCGVMAENLTGFEIIITTYFPYSKKIWRRICPKGKPNFEALKVAF